MSFVSTENKMKITSGANGCSHSERGSFFTQMLRHQNSINDSQEVGVSVGSGLGLERKSK